MNFFMDSIDKAYMKGRVDAIDEAMTKIDNMVIADGIKLAVLNELEKIKREDHEQEI